MSSFPSDLVSQKPILQNSPLEVVICQVRFQEILGGMDDEVRGFQKKLAKRYPKSERTVENEMNVTDTGLQSTGRQRVTFRFRDAEEKWTVTLTPSSLALETSSYEGGSSDFIERWHEISGAAISAFEIAQQERLGLRYVNQVPIPSVGELDDWICDKLTMVPEQESPVAQDLLGSFHETRFEQNDGQLIIRRGLLATDDDENPHVYVLDFDYYNEESRSCDLDEQDRTLITYNQRLSELFRWSITDHAYTSFKPDGEKE